MPRSGTSRNQSVITKTSSGISRKPPVTSWKPSGTLEFEEGIL